MAVKYRIQYTSVDGVDYTCDISNPAYVGSPIILDGRVEYGLNPLDSLDNPIRSKYLRITMTATLDRDLEELLTQGERYWRVEFYRDVDKIFFGYLTSDQSPQSFTADSWDLTVDALDPMAFLEDLAYVDNTGTEYNGYEAVGRVIANCLKRGFKDSSEEFDILAYVPYDFRIKTGLATYTEYTSGLFMTNAEMYQDIFIDEESGEVKSCKEILEGVLKSLQLTITQIDGDKWLIHHYLYDVSSIDSKYIEYYDSDWLISVGTPTSPYSTVEIKTDDISNAVTDIIHVNENQQYYFNYALGKISVDNEFLYKESLLQNPDLDGATTGVSVPGWTVDTNYAYPDQFGPLRIYRETMSGFQANVAAESNPITVTNGNVVKLKIVASVNYDPGGGYYPILFFQVKLDQYGSTYFLYYQNYEEGITAWAYDADGTPDNKMRFDLKDNDNEPILNEEITFELELPKIPLDPDTPKDLSLLIFEAGGLLESPVDTNNYISIISADFMPVDFVTGTTTIAQTTSENYKSDKDEIMINTGSDNITGSTLRYSINGDPINQIRDNLYDASNYRSLSYIYSHNKLINGKLKKYFTGDFYNFFEPHNLVNIPDLTENDFRVLEYSFDTYTNTGSVKLEENETTTVSADIDTSNIYADTVKPTIK